MESGPTLRAALALSLLLALLYATRPDPPGGRADPLLSGYDPARVERLTLLERGRSLALHRAGGEWRLDSAAGPAVDGRAVDDFLATLSRSLRYLELPDADPADPAFGLAPARGYRLAAGNRTREITLGRRTPNGAGLYALADGALVATGLEVEGLLRLGLDALRERPVLPFDPEAARSLRIATKAAITLLTRSGNGFTVEAGGPPRAADRETVDSLIAALARVESPLGPRSREDGADGGERAEVTVADGAGTPLVSFSFSPPGTGEFVAAAREGASFRLPAELARRLLAPAEAFRVRVPLDFDLDAAELVAVVSPGTAAVEFRRLDAGRFERRREGEGSREVAAATVEAALLAVTLIPVTAYLDPAADPGCAALIAGHARALRVELCGGSSEGLLLPRPDPADPAPLVYASRPGEFYAVDPEGLAAASAALADLILH